MRLKGTESSKNRFIAVMRSAMKYDLHKKIMLAVELLRNYRYIENDIKNFLRNSDIIEYFPAIEAGEKEVIIGLKKFQIYTGVNPRSSSEAGG